jgi:cell division protein FtsB
MAAGTIPAGWYPDNYDAGLLRWWDGIRWTTHAQPRPRPVPVPVSPAPQSDRTGAVVAASVAQPATGRHQRQPTSRRELHAEVDRLRRVIDDMGFAERQQLVAEVAQLRDKVALLRRDEAALSAAAVPLRTELAAFNSQRPQLVSLRAEVQQLRQRRDALTAETADLQKLVAELPGLRAERAQLSGELVEMRETAILQEVGIYQYRHPLDDVLAYKVRLVGVKARIKDAVKAGNAVRGAANWTIDGSARDGAKMVHEFSKLMLRAYNNEADDAVRSMKPYTLESSVARLQKARETITRLSGTMTIKITDSYHQIRVEELELTADYLARVAEEKDRFRAERARQREEDIARREYEREQERLRTELTHYETALAALRDRGDVAGADQAAAKLAEIRDALDGVTRRAANPRAGHVYVLSNIGAFGEDIVKIGMTRRPDPMDRVRELGDASVPFHYDVHAMVFSEDAVGLETYLHDRLADRRINLVNMRREFFRVRPAEVRDILARLDASIVRWVDEPEALEWRQSQQTRRQHNTFGRPVRLPV